MIKIEKYSAKKINGLGQSVIKKNANAKIDDSFALAGNVDDYGRHNMVARVLEGKDYYPPEIVSTLQKHKERLAYNAAYQRDLRTIKRLGLNCTVSEFRKAKEK